MTTRGREDKPAPPASSGDPAPSDEEGLLTSEDLFGDLLDAPPEAPKTLPPSSTRRPAVRFPPPPPRKGPIKVQVGEPGASRKSNAEPRGGSEPLPEDVAALLDAFSEPGEAPERAATPEKPPPPPRPVVPPPPLAARSAPAPPPSAVLALEAETSLAVEDEPGIEALLDGPAFAPEPEVALDLSEPVFELGGELDGPPPALNGPLAMEEPLDLSPAAEPAAIAPSAAESLLDALFPEPQAVARPAHPPSKTDPLPPDLDDSLRDLLALQQMRGATPRPVEIDPPKSRTATKFQAAAPKKASGDVGLDLAALAEEALGPQSSRVRSGGKADTEPAQAPPPLLEHTYGPYRLLERVAVGGMAEVFRAKRSGVAGFEKVVAVKRILPHLSDNKEFVDMFIDEAKMVAGLTHPNIVQIFDLGKIEKSYYIAMEYVHGRDLRSILRRAKEKSLRVPLDISAFVVNKLSSALEYAHRNKDENGQPMLLVHRDISPQNILISFEGDVKLTDFGIAKAASKATTTDRGALRGKLLYMSPEQAWGKPMDRRSDIFSLGIVFYEMLTDQKPFLGTSEMSILETVRECKVAPPTSLNPRIPEKLERVVMKALERDPELRYQDAGELHRDLERVLHERQAPTSAGLARFLEILFDEAERGSSSAADWSVAEPSLAHTPSGFEVEFQEPTPVEPKTRPDGGAKDPMSIQKLLKRFGIK